MSHDPYNPFDDKALGVAMIGTILFGAATGTGIGVFFEEPAIGGLIGAALGIILGAWAIPALMRDLRD